MSGAGCTCGCHARTPPRRAPENPCCACQACACPCHGGARPCPPARACCGERPRPSDGDPSRPGWRPGQRPPDDPLAGATTDEERLRRVKQAILDAAIASGRPGGGAKLGPRKNELLPYLVVRANPGDAGARPLPGVFWESPDIFVAPDQEASTAPALPPTLGGMAVAGRPNTIYAHVWNLGRFPAANARVEFYWFDPTMGFGADAAHLIGATHVDLGDRGSHRAHTVVKCPVSWHAQYVNGGHECLLVRCFDPLLDPLGPSPWDARGDRHVGQRNITVVEAASPAEVQLAIRLGCGAPPGRVAVEVVPERVANVPWLALLEGRRDVTLRDPKAAIETVGLLQPVVHGGDLGAPDLSKVGPDAAGKILRRRVEAERRCDELAVPCYVRVDQLERGECRVYRVIQRMEGRIIGGYTIVARRR